MRGDASESWLSRVMLCNLKVDAWEPNGPNQINGFLLCTWLGQERVGQEFERVGCCFATSNAKFETPRDMAP